jgi:hydroxymethylpyrimidine/phosphomethylpyrimidine kinase
MNYSTVIGNNTSNLKEAKEIIKFVLKNHSWPYLEKFKKHISKDHCRDVVVNHSIYQKKWQNLVGIYKISYLPNRLFT